jgi:hypothetical protein
VFGTPWRLAFAAVALPGPLLALGILFLREPPRHAGLAGTVRGSLLTPPMIVLAILGLAGASTIFQTMMAWFPTILIRMHHWSAGTAGLSFGMTTSAAAIVAAATAAIIGRRATVHRMLMVAAACVGLAILPALAMQRLGTAGALIAAGAALAPVLTAYALAPVILQNLASAGAWGRTAAVFKLAESFGIALSATAVGALSDGVFHASGGVGAALTVSIVVVAVISSGALYLATRVRAAAPPTMAGEPIQILQEGRSQ